MRRGDLVCLQDLTSRAELNGAHGLVVGPEEGGRWPVCVLGTASPIVGVNVKEVNMVREDDAPGCVRVQAWNDLGVAYSKDRMYSKSLRALFDAMVEAQRHGDGVVGVRQETCRSLSNIAWLCLVMSRKRVDITDDGTFPVTGGVRGTMEWAMRAMFSTVIHDLPKESNLLFGAGRLPDDEEGMHLIMTVVEAEGTPPRYFVVDEDAFRVYEYTGRSDPTAAATPRTSSESATRVPAEGPRRG